MTTRIFNIFIFIIICLIFPLNTCSLISEHWWGTTTFNIEELRYTWTINNLDFLRLAERDGLFSPEFWATDDDIHKWRLSLGNFENNLVHSVYLNPSFNDSLSVKFSISFNGVEKSGIHNFTEGVQFGFELPIGTGFDLINLNSNTITIDCNIKKVGTVKSSTRHCVAPKDHLLNNELFNDFELLFKNGSFGDVTFYFDRNSSIRAHKAILAARSSIFLEQLRRDSAYYRYRDITIEIKDTKYNVFKELLRYMYTGQALHLDEIAEELLIAAQKYNVKSLQKLCEQQLCKNLNIHNAFFILNFANERNLRELTSEAAKFIATHASDVMRSDEFKHIESKLNNSLIDVFHAYYDN